MIDKKLLGIAVSALPGVIIFVELFHLLPFTERSRRILKELQKSLSVIKSQKISEHWKQKVIPQYSWQVMLSSITIAFFLVIMLLGFGGAYCISGLLFIGDLNEVILTFSKWEMQIVTLASGMLYVFIRKKIILSKARTKYNYSFLSRILHYIGLNFLFFREMVFDIDCMMTNMKKTQPKVKSPVYIAGLARAGTTILLEALYSTGFFTTLTYRDMPFVTAPYLWSKITKNVSIKEETKKQRAHGDSIYVNYDSPEAFEEVFWMTFQKRAYVREDQLVKHDVEQELLENYKKYVVNIMARHDNVEGVRYLAKNTNNLLRINAIKSAFPDSIFIVPFRNPLNHAKSLQIQHQRFLKIHAEDPFSQKYMNWLGHFEFGANFKPFSFSREALYQSNEEPAKLEYWFRYWKSIYDYLIDQHVSNILFFNYDKLCEQPKQCLASLESKLSLPDGSLKQFSPNIQPSKKYLTESEENSLPSQVKKVYHRLQDICI